ncbi:glycosyltransferase [Paenibacillus hamazuiensis]|uniref:glycosyltransferase n=1 Tax=Paenibacillus hamazuiensis TaxID=2936508 RepID=UPI00200DF8BD|nr:glycosyltransferase [Paenibacillus hamazuiensis]
MTAPAVIALFILVYWLYVLVDTARAARLMHRLPRGLPIAEPPPLVSVVVAAKEEEASIRDTVRHLLRQTYPRLEIIAVNDRSQDATGLRLDELKRWSEGKRDIPVSLKVIHITSLPKGWLGKNHALYQGYLEARGQYIVFTDADIRFRPDAIQDAVAFLQREQADHVTLAPAIIAKGFWLKAFVRYFFFSLSLFIRPWRSNIDSQRRFGMGIGAFNLLTRRAYEAIGTHMAIAMRPDDDLQLGLRVKQAGLRQRLASAADSLEVEWYADLPEAVRGLEKNVFSGFGYRTGLAVSATAGQLLLFLFPWVGLWLFGVNTALLYGLSAILMASLYAVHIRTLGAKAGAEIAALPLTVLLFVWVISRSVGLTLRRGGIMWRGTFYPLHELKRMRGK